MVSAQWALIWKANQTALRTEFLLKIYIKVMECGKENWKGWKNLMVTERCDSSISQQEYSRTKTREGQWGLLYGQRYFTVSVGYITFPCRKILSSYPRCWNLLPPHPPSTAPAGKGWGGGGGAKSCDFKKQSGTLPFFLFAPRGYRCIKEI